MKSTKTDADERRPRNFEEEICCCVPMCLKKRKCKVKITLEADFIKQPFLQVYAKLKGNTNETQQPDAAESRPRDCEKEMFCCVSMRFKKDKQM